MSIEFTGLEDILDKIDSIADEGKIKAALGDACMLVERTAKQKAPKGRTGDLARSITSEVDGLTGTVFSPLEYAPYVEYGCGAFSEKGARSGYWVYPTKSPGNGSGKGKRYDLEGAKRAVAIMYSKGIEATYTQGQHPQPFMRPALEENRQEIKEILQEGLLSD